jgi:D-alanyl-D-alanine carboxypeptidase
MSIAVYGCKTTYETTISGMDNTASIKVIKANKTLNNYTDDLYLIIDGKEYKIEKVYSEKKSLKAPLYTTTPGKHKVTIKNSNQNIYEKQLFIDNMETRIIILK